MCEHFPGPGLAAETARQVIQDMTRDTQDIGYVRVSTARQGQSGLGLEAQCRAVNDYVSAQGGTLLTTFTEIESGKGLNH
jgi:hypothetical protein